MSFDIWISCFKAGAEARFPRRIVEDVFQPYIVGRVPKYGVWELKFPDGGQGDCYIDGDDEIDGFSVNRPGGLDFYNCIFEILRQTPTALWWDSGVIVVDTSVTPFLPPEMVEEFGPPKIVRNGAEIVAVIEAS